MQGTLAEVDPVALVGYLFAEFDGSERMAAEIHRAMLRAVRGLPIDHLMRETINSIAGDLTVAVFAIDSGGNVAAFQTHLVERWQGVARQIKRTKLHRMKLNAGDLIPEGLFDSHA